MKILIGVVMLAMMLGFSSPASAEEVPVYTFVSMPDTFNADVGDVSRSPLWKEGDPNSINQSYRDGVDLVFSEVASHNPDAVFVAGDLVEGHWGQDYDDTGIFGPVNTSEQRASATRAAGDLYYSQYIEFFANHGIPISKIYAAVGDHEIGDNPWLVDSDKFALFGTFKSIWAKYFTESGTRFTRSPKGTPFANTSYAKYLAPNLFLMTLDVFARTADGVKITVRNEHLDWVEAQLRQVPPGTVVIVQAHTPILGPVRQSGSSGLYLEEGGDSELWALLKKYNVDFYFAGEVHANTAIRRGGPVQISHGGLFAYSGTKYLLGKVYEDGRVEIESHTFHNIYDISSRLWQTSKKRQPITIDYQGPSEVTGTLVYHNGSVLSRTGDLAYYTP